jgi:hypothetical protein
MDSVPVNVDVYCSGCDKTWVTMSAPHGYYCCPFCGLQTKMKPDLKVIDGGKDAKRKEGK